MGKVVIRKNLGQKIFSITYFRDEFSAGRYFGNAYSIRECVRLVDFYPSMLGCHIDVRHVMKTMSSWHKVR